MLRKIVRHPLLLGTIILVICIGILTFHSFSSQSHEDNQRLFLGCSQDLFIDDQVKTGPESPELTLVQENSLAGVSCSQILSSKALGALAGGVDEERGVTEHLVQEGDTISSIAAQFDISLNTILWANNLGRSSVIRPGQKLVILPVSGTIHHVKQGDTLSEIAKTNKGKTDEIVAFNNLSEEADIYVGDILVIPGGVQPPPKIASAQILKIPVASSYFIPPVSSPYRITQGLHWYNAIDFVYQGDSCGKPVFAAAGGEVQKTMYGYNRGAGNYVRIIHPNGLITHYGHLQKILVVPGQQVSQGEMIGLIGYTGKVIPAGPAGCHVHFALYSSQGNPSLNPFAR